MRLSEIPVVWEVGIRRVESPVEELLWRRFEHVFSFGGRKLVLREKLRYFVHRAKGQTHRSKSGVRSERSGNGAVSGDEEVGEVPDLRVEVAYSVFNVIAEERVDISLVNNIFVYFHTRVQGELSRQGGEPVLV